MQYHLISADSHVDLTWLPGDLFVSQAPPEYRDRVPRTVDAPEGFRWMAGDKELTGMGGIGRGLFDIKRGQSKRLDKMIDTGFYKDGFGDRPHPTTPALRLKDMETDGIDAEVIYGVVNTSSRLQDPELTSVVQHIYNGWLAEFCGTHPGRWAGLASLPNHDAEIAATEARRAAELGLRGAEFDAGHAELLLWDQGWNPLWEALAECHLPVSFHAIGAKGLPVQHESPTPRDDLIYKGVSNTLVGLSAAEFLASFIFSGAVDRYPGLQFVLGESGAGWIPYVLERMDLQIDDRLAGLGLGLKPSEFWRRQGHTTFQNEETGPRILDLLGEETLMWGSDYPHPDGTWPDSIEVIEESLGHLDEPVRRKLTCENAAKLYGFTLG